MGQSVEQALQRANGSVVHLLVTSGLLVTVVTGVVFGSMWIGRLDQRIFDLEKEEQSAYQLAQSVATADNNHVQQLNIVQERQNQVLKHLDGVEEHLSAQDMRVNELEVETAVENRGRTVRRPKD